MQNLTQESYDLEYRFEWADDDGFEVEALNVWTPFTLTPSLIKRIRNTAPAPEATRITFTVRFPHTTSTN